MTWIDEITIQESELDGFKMVTPDEVDGYLSERMAAWWEKYNMMKCGVIDKASIST